MKPSSVREPLLASGDALLVVDDDLRIAAWNAAAEQLTGYEAREVLGRSCWEVVGGVDELGEAVCHPGCEIAERTRAGRAVPGARVRMRTAAGRRRVALATIAASCRGGPRLLVHLVQPPTSRNGGNRVPSNRRARGTAVRLTPRQQEVLELLAAGLSTAEIAARLTVAMPTVRNHVAALLRALDCHSRVELVAKAHRLRLV